MGLLPSQSGEEHGLEKGKIGKKVAQELGLGVGHQFKARILPILGSIHLVDSRRYKMACFCLRWLAPALCIRAFKILVTKGDVMARSTAL